jgi:hypothetical protein
VSCLHKGNFAQPFQYGLDVLSSDIPSWKEIALACERSPALMGATLSPFAATLLPAASALPSFCIFYGADEASDRELIRSVGASVFGSPQNFSILGKSPPPLQLVADFRHGLVCSDIPRHATKKQILSFYETLLGINGEISRVLMPRDTRLLALVTGPLSHLDNVPQSISVSAIVHPETRLYDSLPGFSTSEQMNARILFHAQQQKGGIGQKFVELIEQNQSKPFKIWVTRQIHYFIKQVQPKTRDERIRALAVSLLWVAGRLGIKWQILPWRVERLERVLKQLFVASCRPLPDFSALEGAAIEKLRQHLREAKKLELLRSGHKLHFTDQQVKEADVYLSGDYIYVKPALLSQWLPGNDGELAINYLDKQSLLVKNLFGRRTKAVQKFIRGKRESFYGIHISFLGEGFPAKPEVGEAGGGEDEGTAVVTEPGSLLERLTREFDQHKAADQSQTDDPGVAPVGGGGKVGE